MVEPNEKGVQAAAAAIMDSRLGWNRPHLGIMEEIHRKNAEEDARAAIAAYLRATQDTPNA